MHLQISHTFPEHLWIRCDCYLFFCYCQHCSHAKPFYFNSDASWISVPESMLLFLYEAKRIVITSQTELTVKPFGGENVSKEREKGWSVQQWSKCDRRISSQIRHQLISFFSCCLLEVWDLGDAIETAVSSFILKAENSLVKKNWDCRGRT